MKSNLCAFIGSGDLAARCALQLSDLDLNLLGVCRNPDLLPVNFQGIMADYTTPGALDFLSEQAPDYLITTFKPLQFSLAGYEKGFVQAAKNVVDGLGDHSPRLVIFVSSTRVFAEKEGQWITESSARTKIDPLGEAIIEAEQVLRRANLKVVTLYCSGLYGGESDDYLVKRLKDGVFSPDKYDRYTNRIHRQDVAGFLAWLIRLELFHKPVSESYIVSDNSPAAIPDIEGWLAEQLKISRAPPPSQSDKSFRIRAGNKRCDSSLMQATGYRLQFPDYKAGYLHVLDRSKG